MHSGLFYSVILIGTLFSHVTYAQLEQVADTPEDLQQLSQLVNAGQYQQAFTQSQTLLDDWTGDPVFDYWYGLAALNSGELEQARFAFERILIAQPTHHRARLELARLQMAQGQWRHATENFNTVLDSNPPETVRQNIQRMLDELSRRTAAQQSQQHLQLSVSSGYDSNINSATSLHSIDLNFAGLGTLTAVLPDTSRAQSAAFTKLQGDAVWLIPSTQQRQWITAIQAEHKQLVEDLPLDQTQLAFTVGVKQHIGLNQFKLLAQSQSVWRDGDPLLWSPALTAQWQRRLSQHTRFGLNSRWSGIRYNDLPKLDSDIYQLSPQLLWQQGAHQGFVQPFIATERLRHRERKHLDHQQWGISTRYQLQPLPDWAFSTYAQWQRADYDQQHPTFGQKRQDDYWHIGAEGHYQLRPKWQLWSEVRHSVQDSNLALFEYDRTSLELGVRYLWQ